MADNREPIRIVARHIDIYPSGYTLSDLIEELVDNRERFGEDVKITEIEDGTLSLVVYRMETNAEMENRLEQADNYVKRLKEAELKKLAELKAKYPNA